MVTLLPSVLAQDTGEAFGIVINAFSCLCTNSQIENLVFIGLVNCFVLAGSQTCFTIIRFDIIFFQPLGVFNLSGFVA